MKRFITASIFVLASTVALAGNGPEADRVLLQQIQTDNLFNVFFLQARRTFDLSKAKGAAQGAQDQTQAYLDNNPDLPQDVRDRIEALKIGEASDAVVDALNTAGIDPALQRDTEALKVAAPGLVENDKTLITELRARLTQANASGANGTTDGTDCDPNADNPICVLTGLTSAATETTLAELETWGTEFSAAVAAMDPTKPETLDLTSWFEKRRDLRDRLLVDLGMFDAPVTEVEAGGLIVVNSKANMLSPRGDRYWVTLVEVGATPDAVGTGDRVTHSYALDGSREIRHKAAMAPGNYELRLHSHHDGTAGNRNVIQFWPITVTEPAPMAATANKTTFAPGEAVELSFGRELSSPPTDAYYVTITKRGADPSDLGKDLYPDGGSFTIVEDGSTTVSQLVPNEPGEYVVRVHDHLVKPGDTNVRQEIEIIVEAPAQTN